MFRVAAQAVADATVQEVLDQGRVFPALEDIRAEQIIHHLLANTGYRFYKIPGTRTVYDRRACLLLKVYMTVNTWLVNIAFSQEVHHSNWGIPCRYSKFF